MNSGHDDRLDAVTQDLHSVLERKLGDLLGHVQAAQRLAREVEGADREIRRKEGLMEHLRDAGRGEHAAMVEREVEALSSMRDARVEDLAALVGELHG